MRRFLLFLLAAMFCAHSSFAASPQTGGPELVRREFLGPSAGTKPGPVPNAPVLLAFTLVPPEGVYAYGPEAVEGLPTRATAVYVPITSFSGKVPPAGGGEFNTLLAEKGRELKVKLPPAVPKKDTAFASLVQPGYGSAETPVYPGPVTFWVEVPSFAPYYSGGAFRVTISGLFCSPTSCAPFESTQEFELEGAEAADFVKAADQPWWGEYEKGAVVQLEAPVLGPLAAPDPSDPVPDSGLASLFPADDGRPQPIKTEAEKALERHSALYSAFTPSFANPDLEVQAFGEALALGLIAGLLLNLMPCVLPVVSLKFTALLAVTAMTDRKVQAKAFRLHCLVFALGILTWFAVMAALLGMVGWAWGELFQSPVILVCLGLILFVLGLSLFGVFSLPVFDLKVNTPSHPHWQAFAGGLLATLLATPCSGPLLGGVLGWALRQPMHVLTSTVISVGVGMSLPYGILALNPKLVHLLPKPGAWTLRLEQLLGFFLIGSVLYLATLLPAEWLPAFLFNLFAVTFAAWLWGQIGHLGASRLRRIVARTLAAVVVVLTAWWGMRSVQQDFIWEAFDPEFFAENLGKEPMLLEFTADWCPSCKALEHTTLNKKRMARLREKYKMRTIRVDLTRGAPIEKELLRSLNSVSIPVIAVFPKGDAAKSPLVLRDLVTPTQLTNALEEALKE